MLMGDVQVSSEMTGQVMAGLRKPLADLGVTAQAIFRVLEGMGVLRQLHTPRAARAETRQEGREEQGDEPLPCLDKAEMGGMDAMGAGRLDS